MLERRPLRRRLELVLELEPVHDVCLLANAAAAEVPVAHSWRELDGLGHLVHRQLSQLGSQHHFMRRTDLRFNESDTLHFRNDSGEFEGLRGELHVEPGWLPRSDQNTLDHDRGVTDQLDAHGSLARRDGYDDEASIGC